MSTARRRRVSVLTLCLAALGAGLLADVRFPGPVWDVEPAPDGRHVAVANGNGTVYVCRLSFLPAAVVPTPPRLPQVGSGSVLA
jgi:hypothetical protein